MNEHFKYQRNYSMITFSAVGRTTTPDSVIPIIERICKPLAERNCWMHSGGAKGADSLFADTYREKLNGGVEIFLPWNGYNNIFTESYGIDIRRVFASIPKRAFVIAEQADPNWNVRWEATKALDARNAQIHLGFSCDRPVDFALYFDDTPEDLDSGTQRGLQIAKNYNIPCFNLYDEKSFDEVMNLMKKIDF